MNETFQSLEGGCGCGATRIKLRAKPLFVHACHCILCQKSSGSVFGITTIMLEQDIEVSAGSLVTKAMKRAPLRSRHACSVCSEPIYNTATNHPATAIFRSGLLDDPRQITIDAHMFTKRKRE